MRRGSEALLLGCFENLSLPLPRAGFKQTRGGAGSLAQSCMPLPAVLPTLALRGREWSDGMSRSLNVRL